MLSTGDAGLIAVAKSLLEGEEIDFFVKGDGLQDLFGLGRITGFSYAMGPAEFWVREPDAGRARELLAGLTPPDKRERPPLSAATYRAARIPDAGRSSGTGNAGVS